MKTLKIMIVILLLTLAIGTVSAAENISDDAINDDNQEILKTVQKDITTNDQTDIRKTAQNDIYTSCANSFASLADEMAGKDVMDLNRDYKFNNGTDNNQGINISKDNFVLNGNGHTIDAKNQSRIFRISGNNVTFNNLILIGGNADKGGTISANSSLILNNVTFINSYASKDGGAVGIYGEVTLNCNNSRFIDNYAVEGGSSIVVQTGKLNLYNSCISSKYFAKAGQIMASTDAQLYIENATFANTTAQYSPAIYLLSSKIRIIDSRFINLKANLTAGAMSLKNGGELYIKNCEFINTTSSRNAGAIYADITGVFSETGNVTILDSAFKDTASEFGGAYLQLGGQLLIKNTEFINSHAGFNGGAVYLSFTESEINNCTFDSNAVEVDEDYPSYGGAIFSDNSTLNINDSKFFNNQANVGNAIYALDNTLNVKNSEFKNNSNAIYTDFDKKCNIDKNNSFNNDNVSTNNTFYNTIISSEAQQLTLVNNSVNVDTLPSKYDLRDSGWVSSVKDQGWANFCWTFAMTDTLELTLSKATGNAFNLSMDNMKTLMRYTPYGVLDVFEGGFNLISTNYLLSWLGAIPYEAESYDELGKIVPLITTNQDIHVQDIIFIPNNEIPKGTQMKRAILKYGALAVSFFGQSTYDDECPYYNPITYGQYADMPETANHEVVIVGWDDNFPTVGTYFNESDVNYTVEIM